MIFVTFGTQKIQFNRLLVEIDRLAKAGFFDGEELIVQGYSNDFKTEKFQILEMIDPTRFDQLMKEARIVITHSGSGNIIACEKLFKRYIIVPRLKEFNEHVDDHQLELAKVFAEKGNALLVEEISELENSILHVEQRYKHINMNISNERLLESLNKNIRSYLSGSKIEMDSKKSMCLISNMYPSNEFPFYGTFVESFYTSSIFDFNIDKVVMKKQNSRIRKIIEYFGFYFEILFKLIFKSYDYIYVHYASHCALPILIVLKIKKLNLYVNVHGSDVIPENEKQRKFEKLARKLIISAHRVIVPSQYFSRVVQSKYNIEESIIRVYPSGGVNTSIFFPYKNDKITSFCRKYKLDLKYKFIGFAGRLSFGKGWDILLDAIEILNNYDESFFLDKRIIVVGNGNEELLFKDTMEKKGLSNIVICIDMLSPENLSLFFNTLEVFIFPTVRKQESLGLVALESMSCGVPVIASSAFAIPEYIINNENGMLFEVGSSRELSIKISQYFAMDEKERDSLKSNAYTASQKYSKDFIEYLRKRIFE